MGRLEPRRGRLRGSSLGGADGRSARDSCLRAPSCRRSRPSLGNVALDDMAGVGTTWRASQDDMADEPGPQPIRRQVSFVSRQGIIAREINLEDLSQTERTFCAVSSETAVRSSTRASERGR